MTRRCRGPATTVHCKLTAGARRPLNGKAVLPAKRPLHVRPYQPEDAAALIALKRDTIRRINSRDYSPAQVDAWAPDEAAMSRWPQSVPPVRSGSTILRPEVGSDTIMAKQTFCSTDRDGTKRVWDVERHEQLPLYDRDGSHPSLTGSYLAACLMYGVLFQRGVADLEVDVARLAAADRQLLQRAAAAVTLK